MSDDIGVLNRRLRHLRGCWRARYDAARTWYVGDSPQTDIAGAQRRRTGTVWFNWEGKTYPEGVPQPQHTIDSLDALISLLPDPVAHLKRP